MRYGDVIAQFCCFSDMKKVKRTHSSSKKDDTPIVNLNPHPLVMDDIVAQVLDWLDIVTLKVARNVCSLWRFEGRKVILRKCYIQAPKRFYEEDVDQLTLKKLEKRKKLKTLVDQFLPPREFLTELRVKIQNLKSEKVQIDKLFQDFPILIEKCTELCFDKKDTNGLLKLLSQLPNLKILTTSELDPDHITDFPTGAITRLRSLQEVNLQYNLTPQLLAGYLQLQENNTTGSTKYSLRFVGNQQQIQDLITKYNKSEVAQSWNIKSLSTSIHTNAPVNLYRQFFSSISTSHLKIIVGGSYDVSKEERPFQDNWHLPLSSPFMDTLTSLEIHMEGDVAAKLWRPFAFALQLPKLRKLSIKALASSGYKFDRKIEDWNNYDGRRLESLSLQELDLRQSCYFQLKVIKSSWWPNLKSLKIQLQLFQYLPPFGLCDIYKELTKLKLENLEFLLLPENRNEKGYWDRILRGDVNKRDKFKRIIPDVKSTNSSLRDLKYLKTLTLDSQNDSKDNVTDDFIYNTLVHLKSLQSLIIHGHNFTEKGILDLKTAYGPNTSVKLSTEE